VIFRLFGIKMSSGNGKNTVYVKKFADGRSVSVTARAETWTSWDDSMLSAVELFSIISNPKRRH